MNATSPLGVGWEDVQTTVVADSRQLAEPGRQLAEHGKQLTETITPVHQEHQVQDTTSALAVNRMEHPAPSLIPAWVLDHAKHATCRHMGVLRVRVPARVCR